MLTIAIMQPYLFPYIGYFQLMKAVDTFVVYDNIQYTKKGWINRNRILANGKVENIYLPLKKDHYYLNVNDRCLSDTWSKNRKRLQNKITECYRKAPQFMDVYSVIEKCLSFEEHNLFFFLLHSLHVLKDYLNINTPFVISSTINIDHGLKHEDKVIAICKALGATHYLNPSGGMELYNKNHFEKAGVQLNFINTESIQYAQFSNEFVPLLSIIDVMMFNDKKTITEYLTQKYTLE